MADDHEAVYAALLEVHQRGQSAALATVIETQGSMPRHVGSKMLVHADGRIVGTVGGGSMEARVVQAALAALADGQARIETYTLNNLEDGDPGICGGTARIFIEPLEVAPTLLVIGGGHTGKAVAELGKWLGFRVVLCDDRPEFANPEHAPGLDGYVVCKPHEVPQHTTISSNTYIACLTRGLPVDVQLLPSLVNTGARYVGLIGSKRRWALTVKALREAGISDEQIKRIHAPIGLELEAESPREIALSILAEIIMVRRGGSGAPMRWLDV